MISHVEEHPQSLSQCHSSCLQPRHIFLSASFSHPPLLSTHSILEHNLGHHSLKITLLQIPRQPRQSHRQPIQFLAHLHLTPQPTRLRQSKCQIQHIILIIIRLVHFIVVRLVLHDDVACGTRAGAAARAFHFEVVGLRDVEEVGAGGDGEGVRGGRFVEEGYC
jgi:hypothetical protein